MNKLKTTEKAENNTLLCDVFSKERFDFYEEMNSFFGEEKAKKEIDIISEKYKHLLPITPIEIATSGTGRFDEYGEFISFINPRYIGYKNKITFEREKNYKGCKVKETFCHVFN